MTRLAAWMRFLGNAGAVANAGSLATARRREAWVVAALERSTARSAAAAPGASERRSA